LLEIDDRTAINVRYSCRVQNQTAEISTLPVAIPDDEILGGSVSRCVLWVKDTSYNKPVWRNAYEVLGTRRYNFEPPTRTLRALHYTSSQTDRQTDGQTTLSWLQPIILRHYTIG